MLICTCILSWFAVYTGDLVATRSRPLELSAVDNCFRSVCRGNRYKLWSNHQAFCIAIHRTSWVRREGILYKPVCVDPWGWRMWLIAMPFTFMWGWWIQLILTYIVISILSNSHPTGTLLAFVHSILFFFFTCEELQLVDQFICVLYQDITF